MPGLVSDRIDSVGSDHGPFLLKLARKTIGSDPKEALEYALRASRLFEGRKLELAMSLQLVAAIHCVLGRFDEAVGVLRRVIEVLGTGETGSEWCLVRFSGYMQLGDTYAMLGRLEKSILCYGSGLRIQIEAFGEFDPRVAETCRYLAEAHIQAMQFDEAETLCKKALDIHKEYNAPASIEEAADRRLLALVYEAKGNYDLALEHLVLASMSLIANGQEIEVAATDINIGNIYLSLCRFDEAIFSYQKALTILKSRKGENHIFVASVLVRLADLYYKSGKLRESKSYCENALRIYTRPISGTASEIANGLTEISAIFEALDEPEEALKLLQKAVKLLEDTPHHQSTITGIQAQMGVIFYVIGRYAEAYNLFDRALVKLRAREENSSTLFGIILNQMGLACLQLHKLSEAAESFEKAREIFEQEFGLCHSDTIGVYSNLAATYDALGRVEDSIEMLEYILTVREEKLGTANPDVDDEKKRLCELLKEAKRSQNRGGRSLLNLLDTCCQT